MVWQVAAWALHVIMHVVAAEVCASRILLVALTEVAHTATIVESKKAIKFRMGCLRQRRIIARRAAAAK